MANSVLSDTCACNMAKKKCVLIDTREFFLKRCLTERKTDNAGVAVEIFVKKKNKQRVLGIHEKTFNMY